MGVEERLKGENRNMKSNLEQTEIEAPYELPEDWKWCRLGDVAKYINGRAFKPKEWEKEGKPIIRIQNLTNSSNSVNRSTKIFEDKYLITKNDLLYAWSASLGAYLWSGEDGWLNQHIFKVIPNDNVDKMYLYHGLVHITENLYAKAHGSGMVHVTLKPFLNTPIPLPPTLAEQQRIVNRIESMFAKLDEAKEKAQNVVDGFETRKAAILHKAFTNQLKMENGKLKDEDWEEKKLGEVCESIFDGDHMPPPKAESGIPFLVISNVNTGFLSFDNTRYVPNDYYDSLSETRKPKTGDVLYTIVGSYGIPVLVDSDRAFCFQRHMALLKPSKLISSRYLWYVLQSNEMYQKATSIATGTAQLTVPIKGLRELTIPVPPLNYQLSIVNFLDIVLEKESRAKEASQTVLDQIALLKKSILARAFRGEM